nr:MAG TPA: hypothetical protein [Caudoviricetes sp.]
MGKLSHTNRLTYIFVNLVKKLLYKILKSVVISLA